MSKCDKGGPAGCTGFGGLQLPLEYKSKSGGSLFLCMSLTIAYIVNNLNDNCRWYALHAYGGRTGDSDRETIIIWARRL